MCLQNKLTKNPKTTTRVLNITHFFHLPQIPLEMLSVIEPLLPAMHVAVYLFGWMASLLIVGWLAGRPAAALCVKHMARLV